MDLKDFFGSSGYGKLIVVLGVLLVALVIFVAGAAVGYRHAVFSNRWYGNYARGFDSPLSPFAPFMHDGDDLNPHGTFGDIVSFDPPYLMVKGQSQAESVITVGPGTVIRRIRAFGTTTDLMPGERVVIIGTPDDNGRIQASFIRVMPGPASSTPRQP